MIRALPRVFRTARLLAKRLEARHLGDLARLYAEPAVTGWLGGGATRDEVRERLEGRFAAHWEEHCYGVYALYEKHAAEGAPPGAPRFVGRAGLQLAAADVREALGEPDAVELLYALMPERWGRGHATEIGRTLTGLALGLLSLRSVIAYALPANERSRRVLATLGYAEEGEVVLESLPHVLYRRRRG